MGSPVETSFLNIIWEVIYNTSQTTRKMGRFYVKNQEKAPLDTNKRGKGFGIGNTVRREYFSGTSEALNALQVKFD